MTAAVMDLWRLNVNFVMQFNMQWKIKKICLKNDSGEVHLDTSHAYFYEVQTQLFVCDVDYWDFVVCKFQIVMICI